ncbi:Cyclic nucleotide-binding domain-containing protein [Nocardioides scoriae]|uniref:Cyclic nucleotide-binding domain-containing protein n=1 Tax=Nocardioides scoriae TaxID=642780 RepID=A0A1H1LKE5_9ACTN|nr:cyclic nucleotide-binding domain-containing protein [Nocardioides scoriae]SDR75033.1 Cyclic nucleotide-binding domain-containing protein [Nocardioides scoriae]
MPDVTPRLSELPVIGTLPAETLKDLERVGRLVRIPAGWSPVHELEPADKAYVVLVGQLEVTQGDSPIATIGPGSLAGEMGLVDHRLRNARLVAVHPVTVLAWPRADFQRLRHAHQDFDLLVRHTTQERHVQNDITP